MNKMQVIHAFWSSFGLKAYDETSVPDEAVLPYITYDVSSNDLNNAVIQTASIWYRDTSWEAVTQKEMQIADAIGKGGVILPYDGGAAWIVKASPWAQRVADADDSIRRIVLNIGIEFLD